MKIYDEYLEAVRDLYLALNAYAFTASAMCTEIRELKDLRITRMFVNSFPDVTLKEGDDFKLLSGSAQNVYLNYAMGVAQLYEDYACEHERRVKELLEAYNEKARVVKKRAISSNELSLYNPDVLEHLVRAYKEWISLDKENRCVTEKMEAGIANAV